jgi:ABC-type multidrug transport system fused ATPase/permease subunit
MNLIAVARRLLTPRIHYNGLLRVRGDLYRKLQGMHLDYHRSRPMSDSLFRLTTDTLGFQAVLTVMINLLVAAITLFVIIGLLMGRNGALTLIALSIAPPLMWVNVIFGRRLSEKDAKIPRVRQRVYNLGPTFHIGHRSYPSVRARRR